MSSDARFPSILAAMAQAAALDPFLPAVLTAGTDPMQTFDDILLFRFCSSLAHDP
jgi:hypothetical protein